MFVVKMSHTVAQTKLKLGHKCRMKCPILIRSFCYGVTEHSSCHHTACIHHDRYRDQDNKRTELEVQCSIWHRRQICNIFRLSQQLFIQYSPTGFDTMQDHRLTITLQRKWWNYGQVEAEVIQVPPNQPTTNQKAACQYLIIRSAISVHVRHHHAMTRKPLNYKLTDLSSWLINCLKMEACHFEILDGWSLNPERFSQVEWRPLQPVRTLLCLKVCDWKGRWLYSVTRPSLAYWPYICRKQWLREGSRLEGMWLMKTMEWGVGIGLCLKDYKIVR